MSSPCPCCVAAPAQQLGQCNLVIRNRDVLNWLRVYREVPGNSRKPLQDMMCGTKATSWGGSECRKEGGCQGRPEQCLAYYITAPYFQVNLPFLVNNKEIKQNIEKLISSDRAIKKLGGSTAAVKRKTEFQQYLDKTFRVISGNIKVQLETCPARYCCSFSCSCSCSCS